MTLSLSGPSRHHHRYAASPVILATPNFEFSTRQPPVSPQSIESPAARMQAKKSWAGIVAGAPEERVAGGGGTGGAAAAAEFADALPKAQSCTPLMEPKNSGPQKQKKSASASAVAATAAAPPSASAPRRGDKKKIRQKDGSSEAAAASAPVPVAHQATPACPACSSDSDSRVPTSRSPPPSSLFESLVSTAPVVLSGQLQKGSSRFFDWPMRSVSVAHGVLSYSKQISGSCVFVDIPLNGRRAPPLPSPRAMQPPSPSPP